MDKPFWTYSTLEVTNQSFSYQDQNVDNVCWTLLCLSQDVALLCNYIKSISWTARSPIYINRSISVQVTDSVTSSNRRRHQFISIY